MLEFAFALPLLILMVIGMMCFIFVLSDFVALNFYAHNIAREAVLIDDSEFEYADLRKSYVDSTTESGGNLLPNQLFIWNPSTEEGMKFTANSSGSIVTVVLTAKVNPESKGLAGTFKNILHVDALVDSMTVSYDFYNESYTEDTEESSSTSSGT